MIAQEHLLEHPSFSVMKGNAYHCPASAIGALHVLIWSPTSTPGPQAPPAVSALSRRIGDSLFLVGRPQQWLSKGIPAMSQVVLALDVVTGLVGLGAGANAPTVSAQATTAAVNQTESYQPMLYTFVNATCYGSGTFKGAGYFEGPGNFTMAYGTFNGYGFINGTSGSYTGNATCNATDSTFYALAVSTLLTGAGTVSGSGIFNVPSGTFNGTGTFEGDDVTHYGGLATFQATYGTAKGSHSVTGDSIQCESDSTGTFVGNGTADGYGNFVGTGTMDSYDGYFQGSGTFAGTGDCEGSQVYSS